MRLHYLQHIPLEHPGSILPWAKERGYSVTCTRFYDGEALPEQQDFDWLLIMGGPMNIYEESEFPWLEAEKAFIRQAIASGKAVLGICLGSQLIADVIGGAVTRNDFPEIGWFPIKWNDEALKNLLFSGFPREAVVFHWHYDTFSVLPPEAKVLASSAGCPHQAFLYGDRVIGFQFHMENTLELLEGYVRESGQEMQQAAYVQTPQEVLSHPEHLTRNKAWMAAFLTRLEELTNGS